jgi:MFS family permease
MGMLDPQKDSDTLPPRNSRVSSTFRALHYRNFQLFFYGQLVSLIGTWMQSVAQAWLVYRLTASSVLLGSIAFASQFPVFVIAPLGGVIADRHNRHRIVVATQTASMILAAILAWLTLTNRVQVWHVFVLATGLGVVNAFDIPARQSFIVEMVGREDQMNVIALNSTIFNGARIVGPAIAGILVARIGEGWCFMANAVSYIAVIGGLLMMRVTSRPIAGIGTSPFQHMKEGFGWVKQMRPIRALLLLLGLVSLVGTPYAVLMPIFADRILHGGARGLGLLMGATGVGAMIAALTLAVKKTVTGLGRWVAISSAGFGVSMILFSQSRWFWVSFVLLIPMGFSMMLQSASSNTLIQSMVPDRLRGRVMSVYSMMFMGMAPFGGLFAGLVAHKLGAPLTLTVGGLACLVGSAIFGVYLPGLRTEARQLIIAQQMTGGDPVQEMTAPNR